MYFVQDSISALDIINELKPGTFHQFSYSSELPIKKEYRDLVSILKFSTISARTGVSYSKVVTPVSKKRSNNMSVISNKVKFNTSTDNYLLSLFPRTGCKEKSTYVIITKDSIKETSELQDAEEYVIPSYLKKGSSKYMTINLNNLISIK